MKLNISFILLTIVHFALCDDGLPEGSNLVAINECDNAESQVIGCTDDCKGQKFCMFNQVHNINCYSQTNRAYCDPHTFECVSTSRGCDLENREFICPGRGFYPHPFNCTKFYDCHDGKIVRLAQCINLIFDPLNIKCVQSLNCYTFSHVNGLCRNKLNTIVTHPLNKRLYVLCNDEKPLMGECPIKHAFKTSKLKCEYDCTNRGRFIDPLNSTCYYDCDMYLRPTRDCCKNRGIFNEEFVTCMPNV